jgi:hypothetical protein
MAKHTGWYSCVKRRDLQTENGMRVLPPEHEF